MKTLTPPVPARKPSTSPFGFEAVLLATCMMWQAAQNAARQRTAIGIQALAAVARLIVGIAFLLINSNDHKMLKPHLLQLLYRTERLPQHRNSRNV
jgi:hypothetical protein